MLGIEWVHILLIFAPIMVIPLGLELIMQQSWPIGVLQISSLAFGLAFLFEAQWMAGCLSLPWLFMSSYLFFKALRKREQYSIYALASLLFLIVGAAWSTADRFGWPVLGFDPTIVVLTGAHFHYAGFVVPLLVDRLLQSQKTILFHRLGFIVLIGISAVALGITISHFNGPLWIESVAGIIMALGGFGVGIYHIALVKEKSVPIFIRCLWAFGGLLLTIGMILAFLYASRNWIALPWLSIPWMYAIHGTLNTLGLGVFCLWAWVLNTKSPPSLKRRWALSFNLKEN